MSNLHMCLKAPTDLLAWRKMKPGVVCPYCGYKENRNEVNLDESSNEVN